MKAVVPAAGEGTRLRPLTADRPKGLVSVAGQPLLEHVFDALSGETIEEVIVIIGYRGEQILEYFEDRYRGLPLRYVEQERQLGLAHAILQADAYVEDRFLVLNGDNVFVDGIGDVHDHAQTDSNRGGALLVERGPKAVVSTGGAVRVSDGEVREIIEKPEHPRTRLMTTGCYVLPPEIMDAAASIEPSDRREYELADAINTLIDDGHRFVPIEHSGWRRNVNTPDDIAAVEARLEN